MKFSVAVPRSYPAVNRTEIFVISKGAPDFNRKERQYPPGIIESCTTGSVTESLRMLSAKARVPARVESSQDVRCRKQVVSPSGVTPCAVRRAPAKSGTSRLLRRHPRLGMRTSAVPAVGDCRWCQRARRTRRPA